MHVPSTIKISELLQEMRCGENILEHRGLCSPKITLVMDKTIPGVQRTWVVVDESVVGDGKLWMVEEELVRLFGGLVKQTQCEIVDVVDMKGVRVHYRYSSRWVGGIKSDHVFLGRTKG